uniref:Protein UL29 n=1 Tax=Cardioderma bat herpesvirus TaxID=3141914 RepID=A0AAU7E035_9VIRU
MNDYCSQRRFSLRLVAKNLVPEATEKDGGLRTDNMGPKVSGRLKGPMKPNVRKKNRQIRRRFFNRMAIEQPATRQPVPGFSREEMLSLCVRGDLNVLRAFVRAHRGAEIPICWPLGAELVVGDVSTVPYFDADDVRKCQTDYLGHYEELTVLGYVRTDRCEFPVMLGNKGRIYLFDIDNDCMYLVASHFREFMTLGLVRVDAFHGDSVSYIEKMLTINSETEKCRYVRSVCDFSTLLSIDDPLSRSLYVRTNRGTGLSLTWPGGHQLVLMDSAAVGMSSGDVTRLQSTMHVPEPISLLGIISDENTELIFKGLAVYIGDSGKILAHISGLGKLVEVAGSMREFVRIGLSRLIGDYRFQNVGGIVPAAPPSVAPRDASTLPFKKRR